MNTDLKEAKEGTVQILEKVHSLQKEWPKGRPWCRSEQGVEIPDGGEKGEWGGLTRSGLTGSTDETMVAKPELVLAEYKILLSSLKILSVVILFENFLIFTKCAYSQVKFTL